jgi:hypothetical protein
MSRIVFKIANLISALLLIFSITNAHAQVTFGLDKGTNDTLQNLPEQLRLQLFKLLQDSLPLIDRSVEGYLSQIDKILRQNIADGLTGLQCSADGTISNIKDQTKGSLVGVIFKDGTSPSNLTPSNLPDPFQRLSRAISDTRDKVGVNTSATDVLLAYNDLLYSVALVKCQTKIATLPVANEVNAQTERLFLPALEWQMLIGQRDKPWCDNPRDCIIKRRAQVVVFVRDSDPRDTKFSSPQEQFDAMELLKLIPPDPPSPSFLDRFLVSKIPILQYEGVLASFRHVERTVLAHRERRREASLAQLKPLIDEMRSAIGLYSGAKGNMDHPTDERVDAQQTFERTGQVAKRLSDVLTAAQKLMDDNRDIQPEFDSLKATVNDALENNQILRARADRLRPH